MQESKDDYFFKQKKKEMEKLAEYGLIKKWNVDPTTIQNFKSLKKVKKFERSIDSIDSGGSLPKFANSPSNGGLSERRWKSPALNSVGNINQKSQAGSRSFLNERSVSKSPRLAENSISRVSASKSRRSGNH